MIDIYVLVKTTQLFTRRKIVDSFFPVTIYDVKLLKLRHFTHHNHESWSAGAGKLIG